MFIGRNSDGTIYGIWTCKQPNDADHLGMEELANDHPEIKAFINRPRRSVDLSILANYDKTTRALMQAAGVSAAAFKASWDSLS